MSTLFNFGADLLGLIDSPSVQPNRLCCLDGDFSAVVNGNIVTVLQLQRDWEMGFSLRPDDGNVVKCPFVKHSIKQTIQVAEINPLFPFQGICLAKEEGHLYCVDAKCNLAIINNSREEWTQSFQSSNHTAVSGGFSAVAAVPGGAVTISYLSKKIMWADIVSSKHVRSCLSLHNPTALTTLNGDGGLVAVTEGRCLSVWDPRASENDGCVFRGPCCPSNLWTALSSGTDVLAAGGDRSVQVYDSRNWRLRLNWKSACKYDIVKLLKAPAGPKGQSVYVCGLDNEILLCDISSSTDIKDCEEGDAKRKGQKRKLNDAVVASEVADINSSAGPSHASLPDSSKLRISHHRGVRAESCWAGVDVSSCTDSSSLNGNDQIVGICDGGKLYVVGDAHNMKYAE